MYERLLPGDERPRNRSLPAFPGLRCAAADGDATLPSSISRPRGTALISPRNGTGCQLRVLAADTMSPVPIIVIIINVVAVSSSSSGGWRSGRRHVTSIVASTRPIGSWAPTPAGLPGAWRSVRLQVGPTTLSGRSCLPLCLGAVRRSRSTAPLAGAAATRVTSSFTASVPALPANVTHRQEQ